MPGVEHANLTPPRRDQGRPARAGCPASRRQTAQELVHSRQSALWRPKFCNVSAGLVWAATSPAGAAGWRRREAQKAPATAMAELPMIRGMRNPGARATEWARANPPDYPMYGLARESKRRGEVRAELDNAMAFAGDKGRKRNIRSNEKAKPVSKLNYFRLRSSPACPLAVISLGSVWIAVLRAPCYARPCSKVCRPTTPLM